MGHRETMTARFLAFSVASAVGVGVGINWWVGGAVLAGFCALGNLMGLHKL